jgi:MFS transporter, DHA2 family, multidrug resistance protein
MRNIGGSFGIAITTTLLARDAQRHQALMVQYLSPENPIYAERLDALRGMLAAQVGPDVAADQAVAVLYQQLLRQVTVLAYVDNFRLISMLCLACIPLVFLFRPVRPRPGQVAPH